MKFWSRMAFVLAFVPWVALAQYKNLDSALSNIQRGFGNGDSQAIVSGIADGGQVMLQFPGLIQQSAPYFYGRDQAAYLLDGLFNKVKPSGFDQKSATKISAENQWHITGDWTIQNAGKSETRELYITLLHDKDDRWSVVSARAAGK